MSEELEQQKATGMCPHGNFPDRCMTCNAESIKMTSEKAAEILGAEKVFGAEKVLEVFGVKLDQIPELPFSKEQLEVAKEDGSVLILRIDRFEDGTPFTLHELVTRKSESSKQLFANSSDISDELDWVEGMQFQESTTPSLEWKLVRTEPLDATKHLSFDAQKAFMEGNATNLREAMTQTEAFWDELLADEQNEWLRESVESARSSMPTTEELMKLRASLPENSSLPKVIEAVYDAQLQGPLFENMTIVTSDTVEPFEDEPERPIDLSFIDGKPSLHVRRDKRFGRPHKLGKDEAFISGIPVGYIQY
jgi:hypothetical protein